MHKKKTTHDAPATVARLVDVAKEAGVARVTAAHVLNGTGGASVRVGEATRARVLAVAKRMHYTPNRIAQQLKGVRSKVLGVIMDTTNLPVMSERLAAVEKKAWQTGYRLMIGQTHGNADEVLGYLQDFEARAVEGVLCLFDPRSDRPAQVASDIPGRQPLVFHARPMTPGGYCVRVDTEDAMVQVTQHLLERGRKRMGLALWNQVDELMELRRRGYQRGHESSGRPFDKALVWMPSRPIATAPEVGVLDEIIDALVVTQTADAIAASDDVWAVRLIQRLKSRGYRVPTDVAVTGYNNLDLASIIEPALTTVDQQHEAYAEAAVDLLLARVRGESVSQKTRTIKAKLVVRDST